MISTKLTSLDGPEKSNKDLQRLDFYHDSLDKSVTAAAEGSIMPSSQWKGMPPFQKLRHSSFWALAPVHNYSWNLLWTVGNINEVYDQIMRRLFFTFYKLVKKLLHVTPTFTNTKDEGAYYIESYFTRRFCVIKKPGHLRS